jgi:malonyl CoA-acyl carrier protein transacylase
MSIAFLFPGRGSQRPGMLHRLPDTAASATVLAEADWALRRLASRTGRGAGNAAGQGGPASGSGSGSNSGDDYADGIAELDSAEALERSPVACHVALLIAGVAGARALMEDEEVRPSYVAGHGAGGFAAAVLADVLTFEEALRAARLRGELVHAVESGDGPESDVAIRLAQHLATVKRRPQTVRYVGGVQGRSLFGDTNAVFDDLAWSAARPVRWTDVTAVLADEKVDCCVELPPGRALTGELSAAGPRGMQAVSVEEHGIAEAAELARTAAGIVGGPSSRAVVDDEEELPPGFGPVTGPVTGQGPIAGPEPGAHPGSGFGSGPGPGSGSGSAPGPGPAQGAGPGQAAAPGFGPPAPGPGARPGAGPGTGQSGFA